MNLNLCVIIPGFGAPHLDEKIKILNNNLEVLSRFPGSISVRLCVYDMDPTLPSRLEELLSFYGVAFQLFQEPGVVAQFIVRHAHPKSLVDSPTPTHVMILLDDVELHSTSWTWANVLYDYENQCLDIASPTLTDDSKILFPYMQHTVAGLDLIKISSACELFCYFMRTSVYEKYYAQLSMEHPLLWGIDLVLTKHLGFKVALLNYCEMKHYYQQKQTNESDIEPFLQMAKYLSKFGETQESLSHQPAILSEVLVHHRIHKIHTNIPKQNS